MGIPMRVYLDTNIVIYFLEGIEPQASLVERILNRPVKDEEEDMISTILALSDITVSI